ncbi:MAG TPA: hypothetical protein DCY13_22395 [Verrucomicrobiales bacterium]|nr:hypothetical protein [Verrucomicrobiales bacterium]
MASFVRRHKILSGVLLFILMLALGAFALIRVRMHGPFRDYRVDVELHSLAGGLAANAPLYVGVARRDITPDLARFDPWTDKDGNSKFEREKGDTYQDRDGNGDFDFVWLGGFSENRPAQGVNDPLWTRAIAFRHHQTTVVLVSIDCVGLTHERFIKLRKSIDHAQHGITHILSSSTHTHNSPDTMGIWSYRPVFGRFNESYVEFILDRSREAILEAVGNLQPAEAIIATEELEPQGFVRDSRMPMVYDRHLNAAQFVKPGTGETIATLVSWGNHPEAMGSRNPLLSSDFAHYWREGMEEGVEGTNGMAGLGGICVFVQGPVGGLMTPLGLDVPDKDGTTVHRENGVGKTRALGENLALRTIRLLQSERAERMTNPVISGVAQTIFVPIEGTYRIPIMLGLIHPGWYDGKARSEVSALRIGDIEMLAIPGEIYPEIVDGGIESPEGGDHPGKPIEVPPLRDEMRGRVNMVFNLANDEIGYIIPRTQWDVDPPYTYGSEKAPYGEVNSGGSDVGVVIHRESLNVLRRLREVRE